MTPLKRRILEIVAATGPMNVAEYMMLCLSDPRHGYYATREPFGRKGDFTTAPEVSQMFGELIAVWLYSAWAALGRPAEPVLAEIGPGRGTLMKDVIRTLSRLDGKLAGSARIRMIETSARLAAVQKQTLGDAGGGTEWLDRVSRLPAGPLFIVGNELFDALPVRQYVKVAGSWRERVIAGQDGRLAFAAGPTVLDASLLPAAASGAPEGSIFEIAPARSALMEEIATRIAGGGGAGLFIDYGHLEPGVGDTLQAMRRHAFDDVLAHPGEADLTSHVDFHALAGAARRHGLAAHMMEQGEFLLGLGLLERAGRLGAGLTDAGREAIRSQVERLAGPEAMGRLFKVLAILPEGVATPPFAAAH